MTHLLIQMSDLLGEADEFDDCLCGGGLGVHVEGQDWAVVALHVGPCPRTTPRQALRLVATVPHDEDPVGPA